MPSPQTGHWAPIALLDQLHDHIQAGGLIAAFVAQVKLPTGQNAGQPGHLTETASGWSTEGSRQTGQLTGLGDPAPALALLDVLATRLAIAPDPLAKLRAIEEAREKGWLLSTSQLAPLVGRKSLSGQSFERYGFTFTRTGRNGAESAWRVTKGRVGRDG